MKKEICILSTKKLKSNQKQFLLEAGFSVVEADFIITTAVPFQWDEVNDCLLFTSQNAVKSVLNNPNIALLKTKPVFCVGIKTRELLENNGWKVTAWAHYAKELAPVIVSQFKQKTITFFSGNMRRNVLPDAFTANNIVYNELEVYRTELSPQKIQQKMDALCFYSPSGIKSYLINNQITDEVCFCIGDTTAEALEGITTNIVLAQQPTIEATLQVCVEYYQLKVS